MTNSGRSVRLAKTEQENYVFNKTVGFRFIVEAEAVGLDSRIFLYRRSVFDPGTGEEHEVFQSICSPSDLEQYPPDSPTSTSSLFRKSTLDLVFRSIEIAFTTWTEIQEDVRSLLRSLQEMDTLRPASYVVIE